MAPHLSPWFDGFIPHFAAEARRCGGEARILGPSARIEGVYLYHPADREATIFTLDRSAALSALEWHPAAALYSDFRLTRTDEPYAILERPLGDRSTHVYRHPVRIAQPGDTTPILSLMREVYGRVDERWIANAPSPREQALVVDGASELAGVAWSTAVGSLGRVHSLSVRLRYRRAGVGTDLLSARCDWLRELGVRRVLAEVDETNVASLAILRGAGFQPVGRMYRTPPREGPGVAMSGAHRSSGRPSPSSP